jgi:tRNA (guanine-N7-)-methyltransferase
MGSKNKLKKFSENKTFNNLLQPSFDQVYKNDFDLKSKWSTVFFKNNKPIVLELGCGKGEYTINLAKKYLDKNFIGFDIKGARLWRGAKTATEEKIPNVGFVRTKIEFICSFFEKNEVDEIWITFPDPQAKKEKKRLTSPKFLSLYKNLLKNNGVVNLKTDSKELFDYTNEIINEYKLEVLEKTDDLYNSELVKNQEILSIKTTYENIFLQENKKITYIKFKINNLANL